MYIPYHWSKSLNPFSRLSHVPHATSFRISLPCTPFPYTYSALLTIPRAHQACSCLRDLRWLSLHIECSSLDTGTVYSFTSLLSVISSVSLSWSAHLKLEPHPLYPILLLLSLHGANHLLIHYIYSITYACQTVSSLRAGMGLLFTVISSTESYNRHTISVQ